MLSDESVRINLVSGGKGGTDRITNFELRDTHNSSKIKKQR